MEQITEKKNLHQAKPLEAAEEIVRILDKHLGKDMKLIYVGDVTVLTDYYVVCYGRSATHIRALAREVDDTMSEYGMPALRTEGTEGGEWILVDFGTVIVHVFSKEAGEFYRFERLFKEDAFLPISDILVQEDEK